MGSSVGLFLARPSETAAVRIAPEYNAGPPRIPSGVAHWLLDGVCRATWLADGTRIAFQGETAKGPPNPADFWKTGPGWGDLFVHDVATGKTEQIAAGVRLPPHGGYRPVYSSADSKRLRFSQSPEPLSAPRPTRPDITYGEGQDQPLEVWDFELASGQFQRLSEGFADIVVGEVP